MKKKAFMKKKVLTGVIAAMLLLSGCGGDSGATPNEQSTQDSSAAESLSADNESDSAEVSDASASAENAGTESTESTAAESSVSETEKKADPPAPVIASNTKPEDYDTEPVPFRDEIDEFNAQVTIDSTSRDAHHTQRTLCVDGVPLIEVVNTDFESPRPLVFALHGGGGHKSDAELYTLADKGFCAVAIDCAGNGDSQDGPLQAPAAFMETVHDLDVLVEYYNTLSDVDAENFGIIGYSMGGNIAMCYVPYGKYKPTAIAFACSTPDPLVDRGPVWDVFDKGKNGQPAVWTGDEMESFVSAYKAVNFPEYFVDVWVFAANGAEDDEAGPPEGCAELKEKVEALGGTKFSHQVFEGYGHEVPESWFSDTLSEFCGKF
ncbi:MAG: alpha/beta fold hydrolase [Firmicutes bacterium]|nr:alpha/beta fold hydrolase [Bacillota bacterium]